MRVCQRLNVSSKLLRTAAKPPPPWRFFLARHFIADTPQPGLVASLSQSYLANDTQLVPVALTDFALGDMTTPLLRRAVAGAEQRWEGLAVLFA